MDNMHIPTRSSLDLLCAHTIITPYEAACSSILNDTANNSTINTAFMTVSCKCVICICTYMWIHTGDAWHRVLALMVSYTLLIHHI